MIFNAQNHLMTRERQEGAAKSVRTALLHSPTPALAGAGAGVPIEFSDSETCCTQRWAQQCIVQESADILQGCPSRCLLGPTGWLALKWDCAVEVQGASTTRIRRGCTVLVQSDTWKTVQQCSRSTSMTRSRWVADLSSAVMGHPATYTCIVLECLLPAMA